MTELCGLVMGHIKKAGVEERIPGGLVFTGGGSQIRGLEGLATEVTGVPCRIGTVKGLTGLVDAVSSPSFATGVGLILYWARYGDRQDDEENERNIVLDLFKRIKELILAIIRGN
jgi:cell division protein FtsA